MSDEPKRKQVTIETESPLKDRIEQLRSCIPEAFNEGGVDLARLQSALGEFADDSPERYSLMQLFYLVLTNR